MFALGLCVDGRDSEECFIRVKRECFSLVESLQ